MTAYKIPDDAARRIGVPLGSTVQVSEVRRNDYGSFAVVVYYNGREVARHVSFDGRWVPTPPAHQPA